MRRSRLPRRQVARALEAGLLVAPRRGLVADPALGPGALAALAVGGVLSCAAAAAAQGLELLEQPTQLHVTVPRDGRVAASPALLVHRRDVASSDLATTLARTAADCARCLPPRDALVVVDGVLRRGVTMQQVLDELRGRGCADARTVVRRGVGTAGSSGETVGRMVMQDAGFSVQPQVHIRGVGWVDLLVEGRLVVEIDGYAYHSSPQQFADDRRRDAALAAMGFEVLRFTWVDAVRRPDYVVRMVTAVLARSA